MKSFDEINGATGFANGAEFTTPDQVRAYFTPAEQIEMFERNAVTDQETLAEWAEAVIENKWHMELDARYVDCPSCLYIPADKCTEDEYPVNMIEMKAGWGMLEAFESNVYGQTKFDCKLDADEIEERLLEANLDYDRINFHEENSTSGVSEAVYFHITDDDANDAQLMLEMDAEMFDLFQRVVKENTPTNL